MPATPTDAPPLLDRLRANLRTSGIPATDADLETIAASDFFPMVAAFEEAMAALAGDTVPAYLGPWGVDLAPVETTALPSAARPVPASRPFATLSEVSRQLRNRQVSPVDLTEQALTRLEERDPILNAFQLVLANRARAAARRAEQEIQAGEVRGPLHGVPLAVKDLLAMRDTVTTAGSKFRVDHVTDYDAAAVERLEAAGAVIVGKTRLSEFAYWPGSTNPHFGPTRNPHNLDHDTGGSSSGSGAAVADGIVYGALGSDTGGSIRIPAALCGLVGLKPTFGRVSLYGCTSLSWSLDHLGPLTRTVEDSALLLAALAGHDPRDPRTRPHSDFAVPELHAGVQGLRIGVLRDDGTGTALGTPAAVDAWEAALRSLERQGAELVEVDLPEMETLRLITIAVLAIEAATFHTPTLRTHLDDYGRFCRERLIRAFTFSAGDFVQAQQARQVIRERWYGLLDRIDLLSTPSHPDIAPPLGIMGSVKFTNPFNALGWPAVTVPAGTGPGGLPFGIQLIGRPWDERTVLRAARAAEAA